MKLREAVEADAEALWQIFRAVIAGGDTYVYEPLTPRAEALERWLVGHCVVAELPDRRVAGSYVLRANQPGLGAHVANAAFMVDPALSGRGIGRALGEHALVQASQLGFRAMQFNFVVATNERAIALWQSLGFEIVGRLPGAFHWRRERYVDGLVMYRSLGPPAEALLPFGPGAQGSCPADRGPR